MTKTFQLGQVLGMALVVAEIEYGYGRPAYYLTAHQFQEYLKYAYGEWLQVRQAISKLPGSQDVDFDNQKTFATLTFTKISICLFLLRLTVTKVSTRPLQLAVTIVVVSNIVLSLLWIFQCRPHLDKAWNDRISGKCLSKGQLERIIISQARKYTSAGVILHPHLR